MEDLAQDIETRHKMKRNAAQLPKTDAQATQTQTNRQKLETHKITTAIRILQALQHQVLTNKTCRESARRKKERQTNNQRNGMIRCKAIRLNREYKKQHFVTLQQHSTIGHTDYKTDNRNKKIDTNGK